MEFYIKKNATLPLLKLQVVKDGRSDFRKFMDMIEVSALFFSMVDIETGIPKITSRPAGFVEKTFDDPNAEPEYYIYYQFSPRDTNKVGRFEAQFMLRSPDGNLILPVREKLYVNVQESFIADDLEYTSCYVSDFPCCVNGPYTTTTTTTPCPSCPTCPEPTPTPVTTTTTILPTTTTTTISPPIDLNLTLIIYPGSINLQFLLNSNSPVPSDVDIILTTVLGTTTGDSINLITGITINQGNTLGQTFVSLDGNFNDLNKQVTFTNIIVEFTGGSFNYDFNTNVIFPPTPTPTPSPEPTIVAILTEEENTYILPGLNEYLTYVDPEVNYNLFVEVTSGSVVTTFNVTSNVGVNYNVTIPITAKLGLVGGGTLDVQSNVVILANQTSGQAISTNPLISYSSLDKTGEIIVGNIYPNNFPIEVFASQIQFQVPPTPTPTPTPTVTVTPTPTESLIPTPTPTPTIPIICDTFTFTGVNATTTINSAIKTTGGGWNSSAYSVETYTNPVYVTFNMSSTNIGAMGGFSVNPTFSESTYENATFGLYGENGVNLKIYENGSNVYTVFEGGNITPSDLFKVEYDGTVVNYYYNGSLVYTSLQSITQPLHIFFPLLTENEGVINVCLIETPLPSPTPTITPTPSPIPQAELTLYIQPLSGGESIIFNGDTYTADTTLTINKNQFYNIEAIPQPGYLFAGWNIFGGSFSSTGQSTTVAVSLESGANLAPSYVADPNYDALEDQMTTSLASYQSASVNNWVKITKEEYDNIFLNVDGTIKIGNDDTQIDTREPATGFQTTTFGTIDENTPLTITGGSYIIGFIAESWNQVGTIQFGYTTTFHTGSPTYMSNAPLLDAGTRSYYVRKRPSGVEGAPATVNLYPVLNFNSPAYPNAVPNTYGWQTPDGGTTWLQTNPIGQTAKIQILLTNVVSWPL